MYETEDGDEWWMMWMQSRLNNLLAIQEKNWKKNIMEVNRSGFLRDLNESVEVFAEKHNGSYHRGFEMCLYTDIYYSLDMDVNMPI